MPSYPPPPVIDPPPPLGYWALLDVDVDFGGPDSILACLTDVPVRLAVMFSTAQPSPVPIFEKVRGVWKRKATHWGIAPGSWYWQQESGDTTSHSWSIANWPAGYPVWYYFWGTQQGVATVSRSILLNSVRPNPGVLNTGESLPIPRLATVLAVNLESPQTPFPTT